MKGLLYIFLLIFAPTVFGGPFDPPPTDESVSLLGVIFSGSVGSIYLGSATANPVLTSLMEKFNFIIVVVGTVVVSYVAILSTINTAHEGTAMGKKWSAVWIPMRSVAGMALLVPAPSTGYSMIQVTVMWIILQGVGAADALWNIALQGLTSGVSPTTGSQVSPTVLNILSMQRLPHRWYKLYLTLIPVCKQLRIKVLPQPRCPVVFRKHMRSWYKGSILCKRNPQSVHKARIMIAEDQVQLYVIHILAHITLA